MISKYILTPEENNSITNLTNEILNQYHSAEDLGFLVESRLIAHDLPKGLKSFLHTFQEYEDKYTHCIISGYVVDDKQIGPSPKHWKERIACSPTSKEEVYFVLCASLLGYPIGWSTQQAGNIVHEIFPIKEHEYDQLGFSSKENLDWHTEDAFHPLRGDYIALMCMRNPTNTPTMICSNTEIDLTLDKYKPLFEPIFKIRPDNSHLQQPTTEEDTKLNSAKKNMHKMNEDPETISVLFGDPQKPYWRLDPYFMETPEDIQAKFALESLIEDINRHLTKVVLLPGETLFCDNYRCVHGRPPFSAKYDGLDRWLKRLNIVRDIRKSRAVRKCDISRVFY